MGDAGASAAAQEAQWRHNLPRDSHAEFFAARDWVRASAFWRATVGAAELPPFVCGEAPFGLTNLQPLHDIGKREFSSNDPRYRRQTFALRVGYVGAEYHGYQRQHSTGSEAIVSTVEDDLQRALGRTIVAAGRTDRDVSAVSQVVSFATYDPITPEDVIALLRRAEPFAQGKLAVWQCTRVPKRFHALFSATWRRYLYLFPLNTGPFGGVDVDVPFVQACLTKLEHLSLPYNGFAHRDNRQGGDGLGDVCEMMRCRARAVDLDCGPALCVELVGSRFLRRMVRLLVATAVRESVLGELRDEEVLLKIARTGDRARASLAVPGAGLALAGVGYNLGDLQQHKHRPAEPALEETDDAETPVPPAPNDAAVLGPKSKRPRLGTAPTPCLDIDAAAREVERGLGEAAGELAAADPLLLHFPERRFAFRDGRVALLPNNMAEVATTVWDAEVLLAHALDALLDGGCLPARPSVVELGAGTALAALVAAPRAGKLCVQEIDEPTVQRALSGLQANGCPDAVGVAGRWGRDLLRDVRAACRTGQFDVLLAADVLYHPEHFATLLHCLYQLAAPHATLLLVCEQRRRDLADFVREVSKCFVDHREISHTVLADQADGPHAAVTDESEREHAQGRVTKFMVHIFSRKVEGRKLPVE